jgi:hypothetical protein
MGNKTNLSNKDIILRLESLLAQVLFMIVRLCKNNDMWMGDNDIISSEFNSGLYYYLTKINVREG